MYGIPKKQAGIQDDMIVNFDLEFHHKANSRKGSDLNVDNSPDNFSQTYLNNTNSALKGTLMKTSG